MRVIRIEPPTIAGQTARFRWKVTPATALYQRTSFELRFPDAVDLTRVSEALWWRIALICLHPQWALLRPCRVVIPVTLAPGERESWLRMCDAHVAALEANAGGTDTARAVDLVEAGPPLAALEPIADSGIVAACFSGGRDSITQAALLQELGEHPLLVTTTSPREGSVEHETARRAHVMDEITRRRGLEVVTVHSDLRSAWNNGFAAARYGVAVSETSDTFLFFAAALAVAAARGAPRIFLAAEADVQETVRNAGTIAQYKHYMYSAVTHLALEAVLEPAGIRYSGLTYPLAQFQVQRLLAKRYPDLRDLQYSCWELAADEQACSRCAECQEIGFNLLACGVSPTEMGIDLPAMLHAAADWRPGSPRPFPGVAGTNTRRRMEAQKLRCLDRLPPERMAEFVTDRDALRTYDTMRTTALDGAVIEPEPGYRAGFIELVDEPLRDGLGVILAEHFEPAPPESYAGLLSRTHTLADWISAPLRDPSLDRRRGAGPAAPQALIARPPSPAPPSAAQLDPIRDLIPDPEPPLGESPERRTLRVAETLLDGNELRYVTECVQTNWVSSAGSFVRRFEAAFAEAAGCAHAVACSSGTSALHLAICAAGIGPGDEVIVPAFTMIATANAVSHAGATPVFVDSDPATWNLDLDRVVDAIGPRTRAVIPVHTYGQPIDADALTAIAESSGLVVIEDAAEAHGAEYRGRRAGSLGAVAAFSFYGNKIVTTGEGGMVTTDDPEIAAIARELRDHGFSPERHFWHRLRAFNYRMSNVQAAIGLAQVERLDELVAARRRNAQLYRELLAPITGLTPAPEVPDTASAHWMIGVLIGDDFGCSRDEVRRRLAAGGIETRTFFVPLHLQPSYLDAEAGRRYPVAEQLGRTGLYLPSAPSLTRDDIAEVAAALRDAQVGSSPSSA